MAPWIPLKEMISISYKKHHEERHISSEDLTVSRLKKGQREKKRRRHFEVNWYAHGITHLQQHVTHLFQINTRYKGLTGWYQGGDLWFFIFPRSAIAIFMYRLNQQKLLNLHFCIVQFPGEKRLPLVEHVQKKTCSGETENQKTPLGLKHWP